MLLLLPLLSSDGEFYPNPGCSAYVRLNCLLINAQSIRNKVPQLHAFLKLHKIDYMTITETWLNSSIECIDSLYQVYRKNRPE